MVPETRLRWFAGVVTVLLTIVCNAMLLGGLWASGLDLEFLLSQSDLYDPLKGHCVGVESASVKGVDGPIRVCSEWLDTTDPTGQVHTLRPDEPLAMGDDGNLYYERVRQTDYRLLGLLVFSVAVIVSGACLKRLLVRWYRTRLNQQPP